MKRQLTEAHAQEKQHRVEARRFEDESIRARKDADRQAAKMTAVASGNVTTREMDLEQKYEKCMVSCKVILLCALLRPL
jgi:E3 ubiquitin-protein ligase BRE1